LLVAGCSRAPEIPAYQLTGQILVVKHETNEVLVKHEDIPGFMPAMTMPYAVKDPATHQGSRRRRFDHGNVEGRAGRSLPLGHHQDRIGAVA
jgi:hypothetical protein